MGDELAGLGVWCCVGAGALYLVGSGSSNEADFLKQTPRVKQLNELATKVLPRTLAICGRVESDTPISCKINGLRAVIVEEKAYELYLQRNVIETKTTKTTIKEEGEEEKKEGRQCCRIKEKTKQRKADVSWNEGSAFMHSVVKEVPWYLDDGTGRVSVVGARRATKLTFGGAVFEQSKRSPERVKLDYDQGFKIRGVRRYEYVLQTGTYLTVVGEAIRESNGTIRIQGRDNGRVPLYISRETIDQEISKQESMTSCCMIASYGLALFGILLVVFHQDRQQC